MIPTMVNLPEMFRAVKSLGTAMLNKDCYRNLVECGGESGEVDYERRGDLQTIEESHAHVRGSEVYAVFHSRQAKFTSFSGR